MSTVNAVSNIGDHSGIIFGDRGPFPRVLFSVSKNDIIGSHLCRSHHQVSDIRLGPEVISENVFALPMKVFNVKFFASHGLNL